MDQPRNAPTTIETSRPAVAARDVRATVGALLELSKHRLSSLVLLTTLVGFLLAAPGGVAWELLLATMLGTGLAAFGANALNQCLEVERDARMPRTRGRPLPSGRLSAATAWSYGVACSLIGPVILAGLVNVQAATLALATELIYLLVYTPLKTRSPLNTLVGAVCGALPPMIGWAAATGRLDAGAWVLGAILFVWQIPHFLALAWLYREDYQAGGFRMLPVVDVHGERTCQAILLYSLTLVPVALMLSLTGTTGRLYAVGAASLGLGLSALAAVLYRARSRANARRVFAASIVYLPLLLVLMLADRGPLDAGAAANAPTEASSVRFAAPPPPTMDTPEAGPTLAASSLRE